MLGSIIIFIEHVLDSSFLDDPAGNLLGFLFLFNNNVGGVDLFLLEFARLRLLCVLDVVQLLFITG
jgi:hypothetical protein